MMTDENRLALISSDMTNQNVLTNFSLKQGSYSQDMKMLSYLSEGHFGDDGKHYFLSLGGVRILLVFVDVSYTVRMPASEAKLPMRAGWKCLS